MEIGMLAKELGQRQTTCLLIAYNRSVLLEAVRYNIESCCVDDVCRLIVEFLVETEVFRPVRKNNELYYTSLSVDYFGHFIAFLQKPNKEQCRNEYRDCVFNTDAVIDDQTVQFKLTPLSQHAYKWHPNYKLADVGYQPVMTLCSSSTPTALVCDAVDEQTIYDFLNGTLIFKDKLKKVHELLNFFRVSAVKQFHDYLFACLEMDLAKIRSGKKRKRVS
jgi:hypothetical protein